MKELIKLIGLILIILLGPMSLMWVVLCFNKGIWSWLLIAAFIAPIVICVWLFEEKPKQKRIEDIYIKEPTPIRPVEEVLEEYRELLEKSGKKKKER